MKLMRQILGYCLVYCSNNCSINQYLFIQCLHPVLTIVGDAKERHSSVIYTCLAFPAGVSGKEPTCQYRRHRSDPWVEKIPWRRAWQPTRVLPRRIPWTEEPGGLQFMGSQRVRHDWGKLACMYCLHGACTLTQNRVAFAELVALPGRVCCHPKKCFRMWLSRAKEWQNTPASEQLEKRTRKEESRQSLQRRCVDCSREFTGTTVLWEKSGKWIKRRKLQPDYGEGLTPGPRNVDSVLLVLSSYWRILSKGVTW